MPRLLHLFCKGCAITLIKLVYIRKTTTNQKTRMLVMTVTVTWWDLMEGLVTQSLASVAVALELLAVAVTSVPMSLLRSPSKAVKVSH